MGKATFPGTSQILLNIRQDQPSFDEACRAMLAAHLVSLPLVFPPVFSLAFPQYFPTIFVEFQEIPSQFLVVPFELSPAR